MQCVSQVAYPGSIIWVVLLYCISVVALLLLHPVVVSPLCTARVYISPHCCYPGVRISPLLLPGWYNFLYATRGGYNLFYATRCTVPHCCYWVCISSFYAPRVCTFYCCSGRYFSLLCSSAWLILLLAPRVEPPSDAPSVWLLPSDAPLGVLFPFHCWCSFPVLLSYCWCSFPGLGYSQL